MTDLPSNATFRDLTGFAKQRAEYIRRVVANLESLGEEKHTIGVRMGIAGKGSTPHYKFEEKVQWVMNAVDGTETDRGVADDTFVIYHGANHREMKAFEVGAIRDNHWSSTVMSYEDVRTMLGEARAEAK
jgi:hypothetical protein